MQTDAAWRIERADRLTVIVDAERYFEAARLAFLQARRRIMLVGWDFDTRIRLSRAERLPGEPPTIGDFLYWLVERNPELQLYLLRWDTGALRTLVRGTTLLTLFRWMRHPRIHLKLDGHHPTGASHHQKIVSIDDSIAFCGGIDMTGSRWDTRAHLDEEPGRHQANGRPYKPWHDATSAVSGPAAVALAELCRSRWQSAGGRPLPPVTPEAPCWPEVLSPDFTDIDVAIARTFPEMPGEKLVNEVERMFLAQIASAQRHIYIESQYFASRLIAEAIARRLDEADGPEIVIVNPVVADGWLQPLAMDTARARLMKALQRRDTHGRLAMYHPRTSGGAPIYVHAKITVIDDRQLRIGSANVNNRSLRLDTECDVLVDSAGDPAAAATVAALRNELIGEHLGVAADEIGRCIAATGSLIATIERLRGSGRTLVPYTVPDLSAVEKWLADNEVLDPEGAAEMFEPLSGRGLFRRDRLRRPGRPRTPA